MLSVLPKTCGINETFHRYFCHRFSLYPPTGDGGETSFIREDRTFCPNLIYCIPPPFPSKVEQTSSEDKANTSRPVGKPSGQLIVCPSSAYTRKLSDSSLLVEVRSQILLFGNSTNYPPNLTIL
ncbi:hypothetical protein CEXT_8921 [Caerostris extrusa]|uniref:Uncharacterized protein n=1 Tax=Caerostris extrusa TaxID=172846 RepID=A0AAV4U6Y4_CAEEX|nr:hypothetical protein CEXT_8921 [Caerostris extrusa]